MLAERADNESRISEYREAMDQWTGRLAAGDDKLAGWNQPEFWRLIDGTGARITHPTRQFISHWLACTARGVAAMADDYQMRSLLTEREWSLKRGQARLMSQRALELWNGAAGTGQIDYRWRVVRDIITDIREGLRGSSYA